MKSQVLDALFTHLDGLNRKYSLIIKQIQLAEKILEQTDDATRIEFCQRVHNAAKVSGIFSNIMNDLINTNPEEKTNEIK